MNYIEFSKVDLLDEEFWSGIVKAKIKIPQGLFTRTAEEIANYFLKLDKKDKTHKAAQRIGFYLRRAGTNLNRDDKQRITTALALVTPAK